MQLKSWSRKMFKKLAKQNAWELTKHECFVWHSALEYGFESATLLSKSGKVLMQVTFYVACEEPIINLAPSKYWKEGIREGF